LAGAAFALLALQQSEPAAFATVGLFFPEHELLAFATADTTGTSDPRWALATAGAAF